MSNLSVFLKGKIGNLFLNFEHHFKNDGITILYCLLYTSDADDDA